jgi:hypothetical protein
MDTVASTENVIKGLLLQHRESPHRIMSVFDISAFFGPCFMLCCISLMYVHLSSCRPKDDRFSRLFGAICTQGYTYWNKCTDDSSMLRHIVLSVLYAYASSDFIIVTTQISMAQPVRIPSHCHASPLSLSLLDHYGVQRRRVE